MTFDTAKIDAIPSGSVLSTAWAAFTSAVGDVKSDLVRGKDHFSGLRAHVNFGGHWQEFFSAMDEPVNIAGKVSDTVSELGTAVGTFAETLDELVQRRGVAHEAIAGWHSRWDGREDLWFWEVISRSDAKTMVERRIFGIEIDYKHAEDRFIRAIERSQVDGVDAVALHYPGGNSGTRAERARSLAQGLHDGTSPTPRQDFKELQQLLGGMSPREIEELAAQMPRLPLVIPPLGTDPAANRSWWEHLSEAQREALTQKAPGLVGNLEGLTYADRSAANVLNLELMLKWTREQQAGIRDYGLTEAQMAGFATIHRTYMVYGADLSDVPDAWAQSGPGSQIASFDPNHEPKAAVVMGDLDVAQHQSWYIPGMSSTAATMDGLFSDAQGIFKEMHRTGTGPISDVAMVAWMGYDAPPFIFFDENQGGDTQVIRNELARNGGERLRYALEGAAYANSQSPDPDRNVTVIGHSYGTPTAAYALAHESVEVDQAIFFGSVGIPDEAGATANDLAGVARDANGQANVYSATANADWPARTAIFGTGTPVGDPGGRTDPTSGGYGSKVFSVEGNGELPGRSVEGHYGIGFESNAPWATPVGHGYADEGTQSLHSMGLIALGRGDEVPTYQEAEYHQQRYEFWRVPIFMPKENQYTNPPIMED
ncbi:MAG: alpha/beta hydrolase [bacterium]|nr:alpha/beta hydrolase [bacterium]